MPRDPGIGFDLGMRTSGGSRPSILTSRLSAGLAVGLLAVGCQPGLRGEATEATATTAALAVSTTASVADVTAPAHRSAGRNGVVELFYDDVTGADRAVRFEVRMPAAGGDAVDADGEVPVVVWSHGGSRGKDDPGRVGETWGKAFNEAGYAFVAVAHPGRSAEEREAVCDAVGASPCELYNTLYWDRPHDVQQVFDWIDERGAEAGIDADRIVYGGHSAGAISTMVVAGVDWVFDDELAPPSDDRPIAFVTASPPGVEARSLTEDRFDELDRPMLFLTGKGDSTGSTQATDRRATFSLLPDDPTSFMLWVDHGAARHDAFNLSRSGCQRAGGSAERCRTMVRTIARVGTKFVDTVTTDGDPSTYFDLVDQNLSGPFDWHHT